MSYPVIQIPHKILRSFIQQHPEWNFVYGYDRIKRGMLGQCWQTVGEPNCFPVTTVQKLCPSGSRYLNDYSKEHQQWILDDVERIPRNKPIIVFRKIGQGCSRMEELAPRLWSLMYMRLNEIKYPNIEIVNTIL